MTTVEKNAIIKKVESMCKYQYLEVINHKLDDNFLYIVVVPDRKGLSASGYAESMLYIEQEIWANDSRNVFLVPVLE